MISFYARNKLHVQTLFPGLTFCILVVLAASYIAENYGSPAILCALLLGMAFNNISSQPDLLKGLDFCRNDILRYGVALLGARITFSQISELGIQPVLVVVAVVLSTIGFSILLARLLKVALAPAIIAGSSVAICGVSAALAVAAVLPINKDTKNYLLCTVVGVTGLSTILMVLYPAMMSNMEWSPEQMGLFLGATIHDVAQVFAAGHMVSDEVAEFATYTKMLRVTALVPVVVVLGILFRSKLLNQSNEVTQDSSNSTTATKPAGLLPGFLIGFIVLMLLSNVGVIPDAGIDAMSDLSHLCLLIAMAALGAKSNLMELWHVGRKPLLLLVVNTLFIGLLAFLLIL
jgi:uncharacterized integral membrane protein (TIGR00698 family)